MAKTTTVPKNLVPYQAGVTILTPLDANHRPMYDRSVASQFNFISSSQTTVTRTTEDIENGNGNNKTVILDETYNYTLTVNAFNIVFHNTIAGSIETLPAKELVPNEFTWNLPTTVPTDGSLQIMFGAENGPDVPDPVAQADGSYFMIVEDSYGNPLVRRDTPEKGAYSWDPDTKAISFSDDYVGAAIRVIYEYADANTIRYDSNPILSQPEFQIDTYGIKVDADTNRKVKVHERILRASYSGDLSNMPSQKSQAMSVSYTFASNPVPSGVSVYTCTYTPLDEDSSGADASLSNIVNGGDDKFGSVGP